MQKSSFYSTKSLLHLCASHDNSSSIDKPQAFHRSKGQNPQILAYTCMSLNNFIYTRLTTRPSRKTSWKGSPRYLSFFDTIAQEIIVGSLPARSYKRAVEKRLSKKLPLQKPFFHSCNGLIAAKSPFWANPRIIFFRM